MNNKEESIQKHLEDSRAEKKRNIRDMSRATFERSGRAGENSRASKRQNSEQRRGNTIGRWRQGQNMVSRRREAWGGEKGPDASVRAL